MYIHCRYASRELIDILSSLSFADDYKEVQRFEHALMSGEPSYHLDGFTQFVFDNADFSVATVTGHNTFHSTGGIACVTPPETTDIPPIKREVNVSFPGSAVGDFGSLRNHTLSQQCLPYIVVVRPL